MDRRAVNRQANQKMKAYCRDHDIYTCELGLDGCLRNMFLTFAHRHKRREYYSLPVNMLWARSQWRLACINCHHKIEYDRELTEKVFNE